MDLSAYTNAMVQGIPLIAPVMVLVFIWGNLGLTGKAQLISSFLTGIVFGVGYIAAQTPPPPLSEGYQVYVYWFGAIVYGVGLGGIASGSYNLGKDLLSKTLTKILAK
jgi:hypothetical protein